MQRADAESRHIFATAVTEEPQEQELSLVVGVDADDPLRPHVLYRIQPE